MLLREPSGILSVLVPPRHTAHSLSEVTRLLFAKLLFATPSIQGLILAYMYCVGRLYTRSIEQPSSKILAITGGEPATLLRTRSTLDTDPTTHSEVRLTSAAVRQ